MKEVEVSLLSVFLCLEYVQHEGCEWRRSHCTQYHSYLIPEVHGLLDAIAFAYEEDIQTGSTADARSDIEVSGRGEGDVNVQDSANESFENNDEKILELLDLSLETGSIPVQE